VERVNKELKGAIFKTKKATKQYLDEIAKIEHEIEMCKLEIGN
jgi:hypothetical protein